MSQHLTCTSHMPRRHALHRIGAIALSSLGIGACATTRGGDGRSGDDWPPIVVGIDQLKAIERMTATMYLKPTEKFPSGTTSLQVHIDELGRVRQVRVFESSGNALLDEAAVKAMRASRFTPYVAQGQPVAVTAMAPMHFGAVPPKAPAR